MQSLIRFVIHTGLGGSTQRLHHEYMRVDAPTFLSIGQGPEGYKSCIFDGGELGSTGA